MDQRGRFSPEQLDELKSRISLSSIFESSGFKMNGRGRVMFCLSPFNAERTPSCKVNDIMGRFFCFSSGQEGDHFDALMHLRGLTFVQAVETLGGERELTPDEKHAYSQRKQEDEAAEKKKKESLSSYMASIWRDAKPLKGSQAEAYLKARGLIQIDRMSFDLRFAPALKYRGFVDSQAREETDLAIFPAMLAAIRNVGGDMIGIHRTYLDPVRAVKVKPPGDQKRNKAKKVLGEAKGGMIRLSPLGRRLALAEGIETAQSFYELELGGDDLAIGTSVSLGNLAGGATGSREHPTKKNPNGKPIMIPNGEPDHDRPGIILPDEVEEVILLGDSDSDLHMTRARLCVAGRRFRDLERRVAVAMADPGRDFNDMLMEALGQGRIA